MPLAATGSCTAAFAEAGNTYTVTFGYEASNIDGIPTGLDYVVRLRDARMVITGSVAPAPVITGLAANVGLSADSVMVDFGEPVTGFTLGDLALSNLAAANLQTTDNTVFTFDVTASGDGIGSISIPAGAAQSVVGVDNTAAAQATTNAVASRPEVTFNRAELISAPNVYQFVFNVTNPGRTGVTGSTPQVTNATFVAIAAGAGSTAPTIEFPYLTDVSDGDVTFTFPAGLFTDRASGNGNLATGPILAGTFDFSSPVVTISDLATTVGLTGDQVTVDFGEEVTGFALSDLVLENLAASNLQGGTNGVFTFDVVATGDGFGRISLPAAVATDLAGNSSLEANVVVTETLASRPVLSFVEVDPNSSGTSRFYRFATTRPIFANFDVDETVRAAVTTSNGTIDFVSTQPDGRVTVGVTDVTNGDVEITIPEGLFVIPNFGNTSTGLTDQFVEVGDADRPVPTVTYTDFDRVDPFLTTITFSEPVTGFEVGDISVIATLTEFTEVIPGVEWTVVVQALDLNTAPQVVIRQAVARDAAGNPNVQSARVPLPPNDGTQPVVLVSGIPNPIVRAETVTVTFDWQEPVGGFNTSDVTVVGGTLGPITGGPQVYTAQLMIDGDRELELEVSPEVAIDASGTLSEFFRVVVPFIDSASVTEELIRDFIGARALALIAAQPDLAGLLDSDGPSGNIQVSRGQGIVQMRTGTEGPIWAAVDAQWSDLDGFETAYTNLTFGSHMYLQDETLLGVMVQFDHAASAEGASEVEGMGWLIGPYYVARYGTVDVDARLLWGRTDNEVSPLGTYTDRFASERVLAMVNLSGEIEMDRVTLQPLVGWSYVDDRSEGYIDGAANSVAAQRVQLNQFEAALDWTMPLGEDGIEFVGGFAGLYAHETGGNAEAEGARGRIDVGLRQRGNGPVGFDVGMFYDGIGQDNFESYGIDIAIDWRF